METDGFGRRWWWTLAAAAAFIGFSNGCATAQQSVPDDESALVTACERYADNIAGRQFQRSEDLMAGNFRGTSDRAFDDIARMNAESYKRRLYEACLGSPRSRDNEPAK